MGYMIEIHEEKVEKMSELVEKMLKYGGKLMTCIEELEETEKMHERKNYDGMRMPRNRYMNYRDEKDWEEDEDDMNERYDGDIYERRSRRRNSMGRYR